MNWRNQVEYLFTDKTGTLTENDMVFRRCSINSVCYEETNGHLMRYDEKSTDPIKTISSLPVKLIQFPEEHYQPKLNLISQPEVEYYFFTLAACHSVQIAQDQTMGPSHLEYQASSPDEKALVEVAQRCAIY
jgi:phospholipid-translocating ATPase